MRRPSRLLLGTSPAPGGPPAFLSGSAGKPDASAAARNRSALGCRSSPEGTSTGIGPSEAYWPSRSAMAYQYRRVG